eukprot:SAG11_NODE_804_length_7096_cov_14.131056_5_plen_195_part_00
MKNLLHKRVNVTSFAFCDYPLLREHRPRCVWLYIPVRYVRRILHIRFSYGFYIYVFVKLPPASIIPDILRTVANGSGSDDESDADLPTVFNFDSYVFPDQSVFTKSELIGSMSRISAAIVAGTAVPPTSGAKSIFLWKMPTEVSHNILLNLLVSVTLLEPTRSSWILHHTHVSVEVTATSVLLHRLLIIYLISY